jgi:glycosyltransferase involved in cell wall biosynthesis
VRIQWVLPSGGGEKGNSLGYAHSSRMIEASLRILGHSVSYTEGEVALHYGAPWLYRRVPDKPNVLFTMYESPALREDFLDYLRDPDLLIAPSSWCADIFQPFSKAEVQVVPLGVDSQVFRFKKRNPPQSPFLWLYVGAPNFRKFTVLPQIYQAFISRTEHCHLYLKLTGADTSGVPSMLEDPRVVEVEENLWEGPNCTVDNRFISPEELSEIYHKADGFLFLHCGEGFGLTGLEAMATGLAPVLTDYSGVSEYSDPKGCRLVSCNVGARDAKDPNTGEVVSQVVGWPSIVSAIDAMTEAMTEPHPVRLERSRVASRIAKGFTWDRTARGVVASLEGVVE